MTSLYDDGKLDECDNDRLNKLNNAILDAYSEGKINNEQFSNLKNEISVLYEEMYKKRIDTLKEPNKNINREILLDTIKEDITDAYSKGKITGLHHNLLNERISRMTAEDNAYASP